MTKTELIKKLRVTTGAGMLDCQKASQASNFDFDKAVKWLREKGKAVAAKKTHRVTKEGLLKAIVSDDQLFLIELNAETDFVVKNEHFQNLVSHILAVLVKHKPTTSVSLDEILGFKNEQGETIDSLIKNTIGVVGENIQLKHVLIQQFTVEQAIAYYIHANHKVGAYIVYEGKLSPATARQICMHIVALNPAFVSVANINAEQKANEEAIILKVMQNDPTMQNKPENVLKKIASGKLHKQLQNQCLLSQNFVVDPTQTVEKLLESHKSKIILMRRHQLGEE